MKEMPHKDPEVRKAYMRDRYLRKAEEIKAYQKEYRSTHKEQIRESRKEYLVAYYKEHGHRSRKRQSQRDLNLKTRLVQAMGGCCTVCGFREHPAALQFHHRDPTQKDFILSIGIKKKPWQAVLTEALKCDLLCSNCHSEIHAHYDQEMIDIALKLSEEFSEEDQRLLEQLDLEELE